ncbi:hypothetical protein OC845_002152 [Tilletia horrida]|nr:hypothetical protein OC845_002152 [Tilletia horrida]
MLFGGGSSSTKRADPDFNPDEDLSGSAVWFQPDDTFRSFCALLEAPAVSHAHMALIGPDALTSTLANYFGTLTYQHITDFSKLVANSPCLWASFLSTQGQGSGPTIGSPRLPSLHDRSNQIVQAVGQSVKQRIQLSIRARQGSAGWQTRRIFAHWVSSILTGTQSDVSDLSASQDLAPPFELQSLHGLPIARLSICTGLLAGLQSAKVQWEEQGRIGLDTRYAQKLAEDGWVAALTACMNRIDAMDLAEQPIAAILPLHCAAQVMPFINSRRLEPLPQEIMLRLTTNHLINPIEDAAILSTLATDLSKNAEGKLVLESFSPTAQRMKILQSSDAFRTIAPLSRILSGTLSRLARKLPPAELSAYLFGLVVETKDGSSAAVPTAQPSPAVADQSNPGLATPETLLRRLERLAKGLEATWWNSELSTCKQEQMTESTQALTKELWSIFKTLLFSYTMIFDSLVEAVVDMCPSPTITIPAAAQTGSSVTDASSTLPGWGPITTSNIPTAYLQCMHAILTTYAHFYWVTSTFGHDGFDVYRSVFYSALDVVGRDGEACVGVMEALVPHLSHGPDSLQETSSTYFMLVAEQLVAVLPDKMIEQLVLPVCKPYLTDAANKDAFESAHAVLLAIFEEDKGVVEDLAPYYIQLLISSFPSRLNPGQFEHAYTTVMSAIADRDDALAWWGMDRLAEEIEQEEAQPSAPSSSPGSDIVTVSRKLELQLTYVAQVSTVNLVLLRSVLNKVRRYILSYPHSAITIPGIAEDKDEADSKSSASVKSTDHSARSDTAFDSFPQGSAASTNATARQRLCEKAFDTLSGLDASTREEGLRWWLDNRGAFGV